MSSTQTTGSVLVVGGGIAGIQASLDLADSGFRVYLAEKNAAIGGAMAQLDKTFPTNDCAMCIISPKLVEAGRHLNIDLLTLTEVDSISGTAGHFTATLKQRPRYVDLSKCTACGECSNVCPIEIANDFDQGLRSQKAAYKRYPQAMPSGYAIEKKGTAPCKAICPANPSFQGCIALMAQGKYQEAFELFRGEHPFPGICGRVCHHPCESACARGQVDQPVSIMALHRFLADWAREHQIRFVPMKKPARSEQVAVIGSGPAGLACAYFLAIEGYAVTVFEKHDVLGGMLALGIPAYRLPRDVIDEEIEVLRELGVSFQTGVNLGTDATIGQLRRQGFKAFFMAIGSQECKQLGLDNEDIDGVWPGMDFLLRVNLGKTVELGDRVAVIGGGNVAMDSVRSALRGGASQPFIIYRRSEAEMPASPEEIQECREEGIEIMTLTHPVRIISENGRVAALECVRMQLGEPDESGRRRPEPIAGSTFQIAVDAVIPAIGQESDWSCLTDECACTLSDWGAMQVDPVTLQSDDPDIFAGGDAVTGPKTVVEAIAAGKTAAESIRRFLCGQDLKAGRIEKLTPVTDVDTSHAVAMPRQRMPLADPAERRGSLREVQLGLDESQVQSELQRCLACGVCSECYQCVQACLANAVVHDMAEQVHQIQVGAVILAPGFTAFDPARYETYGYASHPNVVTSLEFERILSASGPYAGRLQRPSDGQPPKKIAWLQCVGSRDLNACDHSYCSSVCCMYAGKQAVIAQEHSRQALDTAIFFMDLRTFGKDFDKYSERAKTEHGVRFIRSRMHSVLPADGDRLKLVYATESGNSVAERFDLVVLSVGMAPNPDAVDLAGRLGIDLNEHGYAATQNLEPMAASRKGIFVCGAFQEPKDIPASVMEASAAAAAAGSLLAEKRWKLTRTPELPPEIDMTGQPLRIGVFVCNCGINIGGIADVPAVRDYAAGLPHVAHVEDNLFTCSQDAQDHMKTIIREKQLNRVVVASCSPRTHEPLFQETIREAGLNKYLFEMANIRDQNTWVHMHDPEKATAKAKDLVRMAVAKAVYIEPLHQVSLAITKAALVVGGGIAGMEAAVSVADQGCEVILVEKTDMLGGVANFLQSTWQGQAVGPYLEQMRQKIATHPRIRLFTRTEVAKTSGSIGNFTTTLASTHGARNQTVVTHGATILATGGSEYQTDAYLRGSHPDVLTHLELDAALADGDARIDRAKSIAFIQCVASRNDQRPYCSKICCTHSIKSALALKKRNPATRIYILYRDIRTYGFRETLYQQSRENGVLFIRYEPQAPPTVCADDQNRLMLDVTDPILGMPVRIRPDLLVLATGVAANANAKLFELFKVPVNADGFLVESHAKLKPVEFASEGIYLAGLAHYPKPIEESIAQAHAAAARAMTLLSRDAIMVGGIVATVNSGKCAACLTCARACPYHIPQVAVHGYAEIDPAQCHGCGICAAECPGKAISLQHFTDDQLLAKIEALVPAA